MEGVLAWVMALFAAVWQVSDTDTGRYTGYVEADYAYIAPAHAGTIAAVEVREGQEVDAGTVLFRLNDTKEKADLAAARAKAAAAAASLADKREGSRPEEIAVFEDTLDRAMADLELARATFERTRKLHRDGVAPNAQFDRDRSAQRMAEARAREVEAQLRVARLPAREDLLRAAGEDVRAAEAEVERRQSLLAETVVRATVAARVDRVFFNPGEQASPGSPVVSLLDEDAMKARFFVPEPDRAAFRLGTHVTIGCDGCAGPIAGTVTRLASQAEFTPPVIYSLDERARLVFMAEAQPDTHGGELLPGQPVSVWRTDDP